MHTQVLKFCTDLINMKRFSTQLKPTAGNNCTNDCLSNIDKMC